MTHWLHDRYTSFGSLLEDFDGRPGDELDAAVRLWCRYDPAVFALCAVPARFPLRYNRMHLDWFAEPKRPYGERKHPERWALAAPRGAAKSTVITFADLLHDVTYGLEAFIGIVSYSHDLSDPLVADLFRVLSTPDAAPELHALFGPFKAVGTKTDFVVYAKRYGRQGGTRIKAYSARSTMRGGKHDGVRFTKIVFDDLEHPDRVKQPANRDADQQFIEKDAMRAGEPGLIGIICGTVLCQDSVLQRYLDPASGGSWEQRHYKNLLEWPDERHGLWEDARAVWSDLGLGGARARRAALEAFYTDHKAAMDAGAVVLWPERHPLIDLMITYWESPLSFYAEDQNEPQESTEITFDVDRFQHVTFDGQRITRDDGSWVSVASCSVRGWWDPIPFRSKNTGRDEAGWAVVASCPNGGRYVLHASGKRMSPDEQWERTFELMLAFPGSRWGYETNTGSLDDNEDWKRALRKHGLTGRIRGYQTANRKKEDRIAEIQPSTANGFIRFSRTDIAPSLYAQARQFPYGRHDDVLDAVERACYLSHADKRTMHITGAPS